MHKMNPQGKFDRREDSAEDLPMYSRLFIVCSRELTEANFRDAFSKFGEIEEIRRPRDSNGEIKGIAYIKFSKTSEAAIALESMNYKCLSGSNRPLKVMVAANRSDVTNDDPEKYRRLFISVSKTYTENDIEDEFKHYGHITSIILQRDHNTGESKGFAYISYAKFTQAARAFEECHKKFRAVFAKPKAQRRPETAFESRIDNFARSSHIMHLTDSMAPVDGHGYNQVAFMCCPQLQHSQVERLFDLVPGMLRCQYIVDLFRNVGKGTVVYSNPKSAAYAVEKLNEFEYPPGMMVFVKPERSYSDDRSYNFDEIPNTMSKLRNAITNSSNSSAPDLAQLADAIAEASKLIKKATGVGPDNSPNTKDLNYCSIQLPPPQPLADIDSPVVKRCFLVCKPSPPPLTVLRDVFCRFGDLINVYTLPNKTVGYARFSSAKAADTAMQALHGAEICGVRMKVLEADEEAPPRKKVRKDDAH